MNPHAPHLRTSRTNAFTLIEIILVLSIIALLLGVGIANLDGIMGRSKTVRARTDISAFETALASFHHDTGRYPTTAQGLGALRRDPGDLRNWTGPYMKRMPLDPWDAKYEYQFPGTRSATSPDLFSPGPDGTAGNDDDIWPADGAGENGY